MIKIDDSIIKTIGKDHLKAVKNIIQESIAKFKYKESSKSYVYVVKNKTVEFNSKYKRIIERLLQAKIECYGKNVSLKFNNDINIKSIILGNINKTINSYFRIIEDEYKENIKIRSILKINYEMKQVISKIKKPIINKSAQQINEIRESIIEKFIDSYKEVIYKVINEDFFNKYKIKEKNRFSKIVSNKETFEKNFKLKDECVIQIEEYKKINEVLKYIFNYERLCEGVSIKENGNTFSWDRHKLISKMGFSTCPYCNRQYITSYKNKNKENKTTADLDHFYSKGDYPFLALSLYNFIPSCQICNSRFKIAKDFYYEPHVYPYEDEFGEYFKFKTEFYTDDDIERKENTELLKENDRYDISYLLGNSDNFKIEIKLHDFKEDISSKIQNSIDTFHLEELYNFHKDYVRELIKKAIIYNESRIDELYTQYPELFSSRGEVVRMVASNYIDNNDLGKRPLAKLTKDICEELELK
ncbi:hypothetical protein [Clostridium botulinum]|uniref:hypothetical protein n=1 Tax=Clostridium botulinum TaxID=1491 RepID=UPI001E52E482|nr:hypothetical protein [Clostridium botulinum]MCD3276632.1 hypothetical protein [Clostridium botulinum C/D]MCD3288218.1 hypothetical protein [Clostridium botulinum C/D]MCD3291291.1 hypothetical protein [Clostridium botulinum C/D]MCD3301775.1 hypothetical protein [Clostridium botulinum C/D]